MSMDKSALELIQQTAIAATDIKGTAHPVVAMPEGMQVQSLEEFQTHRYRFRGTFTTSVVDDYAGYVNARSGAACFIDPAAMQANAIFDLGTVEEPGHAKHLAILKLEATAPYKALTAVDGRPLSQREMAEWLEDWRIFLQATGPDREEMNVGQVIAAVRKITIEASRREDHTQEDYRGARSAMEEIEAKSEKGLPTWIIFACIPYHGLGTRAFGMRLSILSGDKDLKLKLRIAQLEQAQEEMAKEFRNLLLGKLEESATAYIGSFNAR